MQEGWRSLTDSTEDRRESMARALFFFFAHVFALARK